jgi:predicted nucleic acid-binding protein
MTKKVLIDSGFLYALYDVQATQYYDARSFFRGDKRQRIVPDVVLTEVAYLLRSRADARAVNAFLFGVASAQFQLEPVLPADLQRVREIMALYASADLDFVDCCIMALAERLNITQVCTFDRRDFAIFRPTHCDYLELFP